VWLHAQHFQLRGQTAASPGQKLVKHTNVAVQTAARQGRQQPDEPKVLVGKTKVFVAPPPKTVFQVSGAQAAIRNRGPVHTQVKKGMTARGAGQIIRQLSWARVARTLWRQPRQPMGGFAGEPAPIIPCPYRPLRVDDLNDYRPARVDPVDSYIPMRIPPNDDYRPMRVPDCC